MKPLPTELKKQLEKTISLFSLEERTNLAKNPETLDPHPEVQNAILDILSKDKEWAVREINHKRDSNTIYLTLVTSVIGKGITRSPKPVDLSAYPDGEYSIAYLDLARLP